MKIKLFLRAVLYLCGTFLHELSHFAVAFFLGKAEGFSIVPKIEGNVFIYGEVRSRVRYKVLSVFIAAAPLIWWVILLFRVKLSLSASPGYQMKEFDIKIFLEGVRSFSLQDAFSLWFSSQLLWAGRLSMKDMQTCLKGIVSPSGLILISSVVLVFKCIRHMR